MSEHDERAALLAAIEASPGADDPLLVYADWLVQRGDPRGELIHAQLAIASRALADPADPALSELRAWEQRLLRQHEVQLAGPLHHPCLRWRYERGAPVGFGHLGHFRARPPSLEGGDNALWLKFLPDGEVIAAWARERSSARVLGWKHGGAGRYTVVPRGAHAALSFEVEFKEGRVDYEATLAQGAINARIASHINGWRHETRFVLVHTTEPNVDTRDALEPEPEPASGATGPSPSGTSRPGASRRPGSD